MQYNPSVSSFGLQNDTPSIVRVHWQSPWQALPGQHLPLTHFLPQRFSLFLHLFLRFLPAASRCGARRSSAERAPTARPKRRRVQVSKRDESNTDLSH